MSYFDSCLKRFNFSSSDELTVKSLKSAFKRIVLKSHPDKGGNADDFDELLSSYGYLSEVLQRLNGGRETLEMITTPNNIMGQREIDWITAIFEEIENDSQTDMFGKIFKEDKPLPESFNNDFDETYKDNRNHGYGTWLKEDAKQEEIPFKSRNVSELNKLLEQYIKQRDDVYETKQDPSITLENMNQVFESTLQHHKPTCDIILYPDEMALHTSQCKGTLLKHDSSSYRSEPGINPMYNDVYSAYTSDNTIFDKIPTFNENTSDLIDIVANRPATIDLEEKVDSDELKAISDYESRILEKERIHQQYVKQYFDSSNCNKSIIYNNNN
jgi:hypothetical protein